VVDANQIKAVGNLLHIPTKNRNADRQSLNADAEMGCTFFKNKFLATFCLIKRAK
jgi:hypothetical protein